MSEHQCLPMVDVDFENKFLWLEEENKRELEAPEHRKTDFEALEHRIRDVEAQNNQQKLTIEILEDNITFLTKALVAMEKEKNAHVETEEALKKRTRNVFAINEAHKAQNTAQYPTGPQKQRHQAGHDESEAVVASQGHSMYAEYIFHGLLDSLKAEMNKFWGTISDQLASMKENRQRSESYQHNIRMRIQEFQQQMSEALGSCMEDHSGLNPDLTSLVQLVELRLSIQHFWLDQGVDKLAEFGQEVLKIQEKLFGEAVMMQENTGFSVIKDLRKAQPEETP